MSGPGIGVIENDADIAAVRITAGEAHAGSERVGERQTALVENWSKALGRVLSRHVAPKVLPFRTHLPLFGVRAAAGHWGENLSAENAIEEQGWIEAPADLRLDRDMFVAHVTGRSMEPRILDGDLCVFGGGAALAGSRDGKLVLVENTGVPGADRYTIKRYCSSKTVTEDAYVQNRIILEPLNPEFQAWDIDPENDDQVRVRGIFVRVL